MTNMKFRAWDKEEKKMVYFSMEDIKSNFGFEYGIPDNLKPLYDDDFKSSDFMPSTGLQDKDGVEIYQGDILKHHIFNSQVCFVNGGYVALITSCCIHELNLVNNMVQVIGNIYEHSHLLEQS